MPDRTEIERARPAKNLVNAFEPYHFMHEHEPGRYGEVKKVNTIFLTNSECPWRCLMCDLWKNTLDEPTPPGAIPYQIKKALAKLPEASVLKLYNSGNFFDKNAVPESDYAEIAALSAGYERVVVENHPKLCNKRCAEFNKQLEGKLEIAIGLETVHPEVLQKLNKNITIQDYRKAVDFLTIHNIPVRTFLLLNPPFLTDRETNIEWTLKSVEYAFETGSSICSIIPVRTGNGIMEKLEEKGDYQRPDIAAIEQVMEQALFMDKGHVFVDTWDLDTFSDCPRCFTARKKRLEQMNLKQERIPSIACSC